MLTTRSIPLWIVALNLVIVAILGFKLWACLAAPEMLFGPGAPEPADSRALWELAGRNLAMLGISLWALISRRPAAYLAVFQMGLIRESFDMLGGLGLIPLSAGEQGMVALSFLIFLVPYGLALHQLCRTAGTGTATA